MNAFFCDLNYYPAENGRYNDINQFRLDEEAVLNKSLRQEGEIKNE